MDKNDFYHQAYQAMLDARNVLIISHVGPDGDAISSAGAMAELMLTFGKSYQIFCAKKRGQYLDIPHEDEITSVKDDIMPFSQFDLLLVLDCGALARTDLVDEIMMAKQSDQRPFIIEFDHHPSMDNYADIEIRQPEKASTTEVIYGFLERNSLVISRDMARCLLTGILTDTANFLYPNASSETIAIASSLLEKGAQFSKIVGRISNNKTVSTLKLWGKAMEKLKVNRDFDLAVCVLSEDDVRQTLGEENVDPDIFSDISGFLSNVTGVDALIVVREEEGNIKGSLRGISEASDISELARLLGGGGHPKASGFLVPGQLKDLGLD